ncbi:MAG: hypothetical protein JSW55_03985 [Chloroflexota bacterium]|nr:MAG: hypothetical protein JSW55_03985 [Chloroflexota bacterium]
MNRTLTIVVVGLAVLMILLLAVVFILVLQDVLSPTAEVEPTLAPTLAVEATAGAESTELPPPVAEVPATFTPPPTSTPTNTPEASPTPMATFTPLPTNTLPPPTPTNTPVPVVLPTNTPVPVPPTDTPVPQPPSARGLTATAFNIQPRSNYSVGGLIWFDFNIVNNTGADVPYNRLGVMPRKDGGDRGDWFQQSYGGPNAAIRPGGLTHEDNIKLPEAGSYTLRLAICFEDVNACRSGQEPWVTLSHEIPITIS